jgi:hypothetical protein
MEDAFMEYGFGLIIFDDDKEEFRIAISPKKRSAIYNGGFLIERGFKYACENNNYKYLLSIS